MDATPPTTDLNVPDAAAAQTASPTPSIPSVQDHTPYAEMITGAIASLKERNGSSKRRPGRPPKHKSVQAAVPVFVEPSQLQNALTWPLGSVNVASGPAVGPVVGGTPKQGGVKRGRGRPKKNAAAGPVMAGTGRGRGRLPKHHVTLVNVEGAVAAVDDGSVAVGVGTLTGKRRGRPPKAGTEPEKPKNLSGKPLGRPRKTASTSGSQTPLNLQQIACLDLKGKLQYCQSRIKQTVSIMKPLCETAFTALQELETLAAMDVNSIPHQS